jgi:hypothetical protein
MSGAQQATFMNQRSFGPPAIGSAYEGGFFVGQISTAGNGVADYNLVIGPLSSAQDQKQWKTINSTTAGTDSLIDGPANSSTMNNATHPAAQFCEGLTIGGFSDWYMPARNELEICYYNLKPTTRTNSTSFGANPNAVPSRAGTNYTSGDPAQTSAAAFQSGGSEAFTNTNYWSSSQTVGSPYQARDVSFYYGGQFNNLKNGSQRVRAVRRIPV